MKGADLTLEGAEAALDRGDWRHAAATIERVLAIEDSADGHLLLSVALWCGYEIDRAISQMKVAYQRFLSEARPERAAWLASWIAIEEHSTRGNPAVARGWLQRAKRLLEGREATPEYGWYLIWQAGVDNGGPGLEAATVQALGIARACGDRDLEIECEVVQGLLLVLDGRVDEGMARLDEVMAAVTGGETNTPLVVGDCFCFVLTACEQAADYSRAEEWCRVGLRAADSRANGFLKANCLVHYGWLLTVLGRWREGETHLTEAIGLFKTGHRRLLPEATVKLAELRRRQGRGVEARRLLRDVPRSHSALRLRAEMALDDGDAVGALAIAREMTAQRGPITEQVVALHLLVLAAAGAGNMDMARTALEELERKSSTIRTDSVCGTVWLARAAIFRASGTFDSAAAACAAAVGFFERAGAAYEAAHAALEQASALRAAGCINEADAITRTAREQLRRLGHDTRADPLTRRERDVLSLLARGQSNAAIAVTLGLSTHTVHRHVANMLQKLDVPTRAAAVAEAARLGIV